MNKLMKKAAALLTAGLMAAASLGTEAFAESGSTLNSSVITVDYGATVEKPTYTIKGGKGYRLVRFTTKTSGATIYYTTNGTTPTTSSKVYKNNTLLKITKTTKFKAIAVYGSSKSAVMTKTINVATVYGDVTGDGNVNQNDYNRLYNCINKKTTYICTDNSDCNASGTVNSTDLTILQMYLAGTVKKLPYTGTVTEEEDPEGPDDSGSSSTVSTTLGKPGINIYKSLGGKKIEFVSSTSGVTFYYTLDGKNPTTSSTKYKDRFLLSTAGTTTVKVIAYKNGTVSKVQQTTVTVGTTGNVYTPTSTSTVYDGSTKVTLGCTTEGATIIYTTDGKDPRTSSTAKTYSSAFLIAPEGNSRQVTVKAYARSKSNVDSAVATFDFNFNADFALSGTVWNDTPTTSSTADGLKASNEAGISGIRVLAYNPNTKTYAKETTTDASGNYYLTGLTAGNTYQVVFEFNAQRYRPYGYIRNEVGGNKALLAGTLSALNIKNGGAYNTSNQLMTNINSYSGAIGSSYFKTQAITSSKYTSSTANINLALDSNVYGALNLTIASYGATNNKVKTDDRVVYTVTLTNNSTTATLSDATVGFYFTDDFTNYSFSLSNGNTANTTNNGLRNGYRNYTVNNLLGSSSLAPGKSISFSFLGYVGTTNDKKLYCYAEVLSYRFANSVYDKSSVPGNMTPGVKRENDEAVATTIDIDDTNATTPVTADVKISLTGETMYTLKPGDEQTFYITVDNCTSVSDYTINSEFSVANCAEVNKQVIASTSSHTIVITVKAKAEGIVVITAKPTKANNTSSQTVVVGINNAT